jgi:NAD-dependent protein deacetylase/lipoamidase
MPRVPDPAIAEVAVWIAATTSMVILTGAGISTDSGIPDFRGPQGVWTRNPGAEARADISFYLADPAVRRDAWRSRIEHPGRRALPNDGHRAVAELERRGHVSLLVTQNIDGLHLDAGSRPDRPVEIHGTMREFVCLACGDRGPMEAALDRVRAGDEDPACLRCGGILKSATISFGQALVTEDLFRARDAAEAADLFLAVGTSLTVYPVAELPVVALRHGARLVIVNAEPTPLDRHADAVLRGAIGEILPALVGAL